MSLIFDTHAHYDDQAFDRDRKELLSGLLENGVGNVLNAGAAARSLPRILELTETWDFLYGAAGLHPCETYCCGDNRNEPVMRREDTAGADIRELAAKLKDNGTGITPGAFSGILSLLDQYDPRARIEEDWTAGEKELELVEAFFTSPKFVAVGEIGLDYHYEDTRKDVQKEWFAAQINLARRIRKPIIVHSRDAAQDTYDMIRAEKAEEVGGIIHCFSYGKEMAAAFLDLGFMIGIGGVVTYKNAKKVKEVVSFLPMDRLVLETDCPYLAPTPFRGQRNDSSMIHYAAQAIGEIKGMETEEVIAVTEENARRVYRIR